MSDDIDRRFADRLMAMGRAAPVDVEGVEKLDKPDKPAKVPASVGSTVDSTRPFTGGGRAPAGREAPRDASKQHALALMGRKTPRRR